MNSHMQMQSIISIGLTSLENPTESYKFIMDFQEVSTWYVRYVRASGRAGAIAYVYDFALKFSDINNASVGSCK